MMLIDPRDDDLGPAGAAAAMLGHLMLFVAPQANRDERAMIAGMTESAARLLAEMAAPGTRAAAAAPPVRKRGRSKAGNGEARTEGAHPPLFPDPAPAPADEHQG